MLAVSLADGSLELVDTVHSTDIRPRQQRLLRWAGKVVWDRVCVCVCVVMGWVRGWAGGVGSDVCA